MVVAGDHLARGLLWPESVYGLANPEWWRFLEHAFWVVFEDVILLFACSRGLAELRIMAEREAALGRTNIEIEAQVTERTAELNAAMERYRDLVENTGAVPWELDLATDRITYVAPRGGAHPRLHARGAVRRRVRSIDGPHPDDPRRAPGGDRARRRGSARPVDYRVTTADGNTVYIRATLTRTSGLVRAIGIDVTRQRELELELRQAQKLESIGRLAAGVAHEINTPIQFISDSVEFVRDATGDLLAVLASHRDDRPPPRSRAPPSTPRRARRRRTEAATDLAHLTAEVPIALDRALDGLGRVAAIVKSMKQVSYPERREMTPVDLERDAAQHAHDRAQRVPLRRRARDRPRRAAAGPVPPRRPEPGGAEPGGQRRARDRRCRARNRPQGPDHRPLTPRRRRRRDHA